MITVENLSDEFGDFQAVSGYIFQASESTAIHDYNYWFSSSDSQSLIVASEDIFDSVTAISILTSAPNSLSADKPNLFGMPENKYGFTHVLAVPGEYHGYMKGYANIDRSSLFLCIPIRRFEFSGHETSQEFREMNKRIVPILDWNRLARPKTVVYFDNPRTSAGTKDSVVVPYESLLCEIKNLSGVSNGFIEVKNYRDDIIEILSPVLHSYKLIRNRADTQVMDAEILVNNIYEFLTY